MPNSFLHNFSQVGGFFYKDSHLSAHNPLRLQLSQHQAFALNVGIFAGEDVRVGWVERVQLAAALLLYRCSGGWHGMRKRKKQSCDELCFP